MYQKDLIRRASEEAGLYRRRDPKLHRFLKRLDQPGECWPELIEAVTTEYRDYLEALARPLWETGDALVRLNLIRAADVRTRSSARSSRTGSARRAVATCKSSTRSRASATCRWSSEWRASAACHPSCGSTSTAPRSFSSATRNPSSAGRDRGRPRRARTQPTPRRAVTRAPGGRRSTPSLHAALGNRAMEQLLRGDRHGGSGTV